MTRFIYDNEDILLELDGSNNITARYTHGPGIDEPLILEKAGASFFYHADGLGSITEITDSTGALKQQYTYSSFGKIESQLDPNFIQPYTFTAREFDPETNLYFNRHRTYDWRTGRFNQEDPIGFAGGDVNLYAYVRNNPANTTDPFGRIGIDTVLKQIAKFIANRIAKSIGKVIFGDPLEKGAQEEFEFLYNKSLREFERCLDRALGFDCNSPSQPRPTIQQCEKEFDQRFRGLKKEFPTARLLQ